MAQKFLTGVQLTDGSAGSPALSFSSDTNTGIYRSGDDTVNISVGGTNRFHVNSSGIVSSANVYSGGNGQFRNYSGVWKATTGVSGNGFEFTSADQTGVMTLTSNGNLKVHNNIRSQGHSTTGLSGKGMELRFFTDTDVGSILSYDRSNSTYLPIGVFGSTVSLQTNGTERLHITSAGNVGIGVTPASIGQKLRVNGNIKVGDSQKFLAGVDNDLQIQHTGTHSFITNATGDLTIANYADDRSIYFQSDDGSGGSITYIQIEGSTNQTKFQKNTKHLDNVKAIFGASNDLQIYHNSTTDNGIIENNTGNLVIQNNLDDSDVIFKSDNGAGSVTPYITLDGSNVRTQIDREMRFMDTIPAKFGTGGDLEIYHNATDSAIQNNNGDLYISNFQDDGDIIFRSDNGSGGHTQYFRLDGGEGHTVVTKEINFLDNTRATFGANAGGDMRIYHDGTTNVIEASSGNLMLLQHQNDADIQFFCDDGSGGTTEYFRVDGGENRIVYSQNSRHIDNVVSMYGSGADLQIKHDGSNSYISNNTGALYVQQLADNSDIVFQSDDGSGGVTEYFKLQGSNERLVVAAPNGMKFNDDIKAKFGNGSDLQIYHNGVSSNGIIENFTNDLVIQNNANDEDIVFKSDNGSGGVTEYFRVDGSSQISVFSKNIRLTDNVQLQLGGGTDLQIWHDGSNSFIQDVGTGNLFIEAVSSIQFRKYNTAEFMAKFINDGAVELYHDNSKKFETTNTGVTITGDLTVSGTTTTVNQTNLDVSDNIIGLNRGASTNANDSGLIIERGTTGDNAAFLWDESEDKFVFGLTTATPSATGDVSLSGYSGIKTGSITASSDITTSGSVFADTHFRSTDGNATLSATGGGAVYLRPNGYSSTTGQVVITASNGDATFNGGIKVNQSAAIHGTDNQIASIYMDASGYGLSGKFGSYARNLIRSNGTSTILIGDNTSLISSIQVKAGSSSVDGVVQFLTKNSERMRVHYDGNVGIGTTTPGKPLDVLGDIRSIDSNSNQHQLRATQVISYGTDAILNAQSSGDDVRLNTQSTTRLIATAEGNVGIGTTSPGARLQVNGSTSDGTANAFIARNSSATSLFSVRNDGRVDVPSGAIVHAGGGYANTSTNDSYFTGDLGVGTSSPGQKLHVMGTVRISGTNNFDIYSDNTAGTFNIASSTRGFLFKNSNGNLLTINSGGQVGVGTSSPQTNTKLEVSGALKAGNKTSWSDRDGAALTTTGRVVAGLTGNANGNGASALYIFTCYGGNGYQRIVYSCRNQSGTWVVNKDIDEGVDAFDVVASTPSSGSAVTFTFKARTSNQSYTASVFIEHMGHNLDTQYVG